MKWPRRAWRSLLRFGFRLLYNELAWTYDLVSRVVSLGQWHTWQRTALEHLAAQRGDRILELAHGTGNLQLDLQAAGFSAVGLDLSAHMGRIARRKLRREGIASALVRADAGRLPFPSQTFAAVVSTFPTDFILRPDVLGEAYRVLRPGGRLVVVFSGVLSSGSMSARGLEWLYAVTGQRGPWPGDPVRALEEVGFTARVETVELAKSTVLLVVAAKAPRG